MTPPEEGQASTDARRLGGRVHIVGRAMYGLRLKAEAHGGIWEPGGADWQADLQAGTLTLTTERLQAKCSVQEVGAYGTVAGTWLCGWDHPPLSPALRQDAERVLAFAHGHGPAALTEGTLTRGQADAWHFAAPAFMTFGDVRLGAGP
ncbi:DUF6882 domain-containing protein [Deinococcus hopiensis]|uniref:Uncharacterized protein n=1 Tax=Deinococcus hopiensis KR-140 TaxID=695939 RepID=A0A1W1VMM6_9DEIO|nr:DUF6882 domain-containing protein [Deinococcus hopiensis]SMB94578.1 hypothetical protein SAMN00790413_02444 [Deinococcus hopiensis KR-140]